jgi:tetratricopeptide (TPR) repeat protein
MIPLTSSDTAQLSAQLLDQLLEKAHPLLAEGIYLATIAHSYDLSFFAALRASDDGRDERLAKRLARFSFIDPVSDAKGEKRSTHYQMQMVERDILQRRWIERDRDAYIAAQQRAYQFWETKRLGNDLFIDSFTLKQNRIYHLLIIAPNKGIVFLSDTFRQYLNHRFFAAIERLLLTSQEALAYLQALGAPECDDLADLLLFLEARLAQLRGQWEASLHTMLKLHHKSTFAPRFLPYVVRGYALALMHTEQYVEAIDEFEHALKLFSQQSNLKAEEGYTMIGLGDAYVKLATSARGYRDRITLPKTRLQEWVRDLISLPILPVMLYLSWQGLHLWHPASWHTLQKQDWIIARLFAAGANSYRRADDLLEEGADSSEWGRADRKLAWLYLIMGESRQAVFRFEELLADQTSQLSEYNKAAINVGLANGLVQLGQLKEAKRLLLEALPLVTLYEDWELQAAGLRNLAEINVEEGQLSEALEPYGQAIALYQQHKEVVAATEISERLWELEETKAFNEQECQKIAAMTQELPYRQYLVRYQKKSLVIFGRTTVILLAFLTFLMPMLIIEAGEGALLKLQVNFAITPPIGVDFGNLSSIHLTLTPQFQSGTEYFPLLEPAIELGLEVMLLYLLIYTLLGMAIIAGTKLSTVQKAVERLAIQMDNESITIGNQAHGTARTIHWADVTHVVIADLKWFHKALWNHAVTIIATPSEQLIIRGSTASYSSLQKRIQTLLPDAKRVQIEDLSYTLLRSRSALIYTLGLLSLLLFVNLNRLAPSLINTQLLNSPYTVIDLYPYLYLALALPPFWWFVVRPFSILARIGRLYPVIWWPIGIGVGVAISHIITDAIGWLHYPNIYPPLLTLMLLTTVLAALWQRSLLPPLPQSIKNKSSPMKRRINQLFAPKKGAPKLLLSALLFFMILMSGIYIIEEVRAYNYLSLGNLHLKEATEAALSLQDKEKSEQHLAHAIAAYNQILELTPQNVLALRGRAAALIQMNRFSEAFQDYQEAHKREPDNPIIYAEEGAAYQTWSLTLPPEEIENKRKWAELAIIDFTKATQLDNRNLDYYLGRGIAYQAAGQWEKALENYDEMLAIDPNNSQVLIAKGWVYLEQGNVSQTKLMENAQRDSVLEESRRQHYQAALESFQKASQIDNSSVDLWLAIGYVQYRLQDYSDALKSWQGAVILEPNNTIALTSRASAYWRLATLEGEPCQLQTSDPIWQSKQRTKIKQLEYAIADLSKALELKPNDFTYRTRAQLSYLLRHCPGYTYQEQLRQAIQDYQQAIIKNTNDSGYWQYLARLQTALHITIRDNQKEAQEAYNLLSSAAKTIERSYELDPDDQFTQIWRNTYIPDAALEQGTYHYDQGHYQLAQGYFQIVSTSHPTHIEAAVKAGAAAFAQGNTSQAATLYHQALTYSEESDLELLRTITDEIMRLVRHEPQLTVDTIIEMYRDLRHKREIPSVGADRTSAETAETWYMRAEFYFQLAYKSFRLEGDEVAREILEGAIIDINKAAQLDSRYQERRDFFTEAAYGWFYLRRGDNSYNKRSYDDALVDYEQAINILLPVLPITVSDISEAFLSAGLTSLALNEPQQATAWYAEGIRLAETYNESGIIRLARLKLNALIQSQPQLEASANEIKGKLIEVQSRLEEGE